MTAGGDRNNAGSALVRVCVTGPESTGKTTLAAHLAEAWHTVWVPEASRAYAERKAAPLTVDDVVPIAREHVEMAEAAARVATNVLVLDTDLVSTAIYSQHYYGAVAREVDVLERMRRADLYLLCDVDVPWVPDGIRDRPENREEMLELFRAALDTRGLRWTMIRGGWVARWDTAVRAVEALAHREGGALRTPASP